MSKAPKIPPEQQSFAGQKPDIEGEGRDRRDNRTDLHDGQPGDAGVNLDTQGRFGNLKQNTTHQGYQQDR